MKSVIGNERRVFYGWWIVGVAAMGLATGYGPFIVYTFGVFFESVSQEFQLSRAETSLPFSLSLVVMCLAMPLIGNLRLTPSNSAFLPHIWRSFSFAWSF